MKIHCPACGLEHEFEYAAHFCTGSVCAWKFVCPVFQIEQVWIGPREECPNHDPGRRPSPLRPFNFHSI